MDPISHLQHHILPAQRALRCGHLYPKAAICRGKGLTNRQKVLFGLPASGTEKAAVTPRPAEAAQHSPIGSLGPPLVGAIRACQEVYVSAESNKRAAIASPSTSEETVGWEFSIERERGPDILWPRTLLRAYKRSPIIALKLQFSCEPSFDCIHTHLKNAVTHSCMLSAPDASESGASVPELPGKSHSVSTGICAASQKATDPLRGEWRGCTNPSHPWI